MLDRTDFSKYKIRLIKRPGTCAHAGERVEDWGIISFGSRLRPKALRAFMCKGVTYPNEKRGHYRCVFEHKTVFGEEVFTIILKANHKRKCVYAITIKPATLEDTKFFKEHKSK